MAGIAAVLSAVARAQWRDLRSLQSIAGNNFFLFVLLLMQDPKSAEFFVILIGTLVLFPLSADPLRTVPPDRLLLWPFRRSQLAVIRIASLALSPIVWIVVLLMLRTAKLRPVLEISAALGLIQAILLASNYWRRRLPQWNVLRLVPQFPGSFGQLVQKDMRQMLCTLDVYMGLLLALVGISYRWIYSSPDPAAIPVLTLVVVLAFSTFAQCLFGLDGAGIARYQLMPIAGWRILLAKDVAWLLLLAPLVIGLSPITGITGGLVALGVGHHASVRKPVAQLRWRFTSGRLLPVGIVQVVAMFAAGIAYHRSGLWWSAGSVGFWLVSVFGYGLIWDRQK